MAEESTDRGHNILHDKIASLEQQIEELKKGQAEIKKDIHTKHRDLHKMLENVMNILQERLPSNEKEKEVHEKQHKEVAEKTNVLENITKNKVSSIIPK